VWACRVRCCPSRRRRRRVSPGGRCRSRCTDDENWSVTCRGSAQHHDRAHRRRRSGVANHVRRRGAHVDAARPRARRWHPSTRPAHYAKGLSTREVGRPRACSRTSGSWGGHDELAGNWWVVRGQSLPPGGMPQAGVAGLRERGVHHGERIQAHRHAGCAVGRRSRCRGSSRPRSRVGVVADHVATVVDRRRKR
jgi:hypothetical protein